MLTEDLVACRLIISEQPFHRYDMIASRRLVPLGGAGTIKIVSSKPKAAAPHLGSMSKWNLLMAS
jgi:hypothetical protein